MSIYIDISNTSNIIFFDLGANRGKITNFFIDYFNRNQKTFKFYLFEPVKENSLHLKSFFKNSLGKEVEIINAAAWINDGEITFSVGTKPNGTNSKITDIIDEFKYDKAKYKRKDTVKCLNFDKFFKESLDLNDFKDSLSIIKMDIEGAEYDVLDSMIESNSISKIDILLIEFHKQKFENQARDCLKRIFKKNKDIIILKEVCPIRLEYSQIKKEDLNNEFFKVQ